MSNLARRASEAICCWPLVMRYDARASARENNARPDGRNNGRAALPDGRGITPCFVTKTHPGPETVMTNCWISRKEIKRAHFSSQNFEKFSRVFEFTRRTTQYLTQY